MRSVLSNVNFAMAKGALLVLFGRCAGRKSTSFVLVAHHLAFGLDRIDNTSNAAESTHCVKGLPEAFSTRARNTFQSG
jgi:ABC-type uncharacterized transport system YnjBCD ATPase subunit